MFPSGLAAAKRQGQQSCPKGSPVWLHPSLVKHPACVCVCVLCGFVYLYVALLKYQHFPPLTRPTSLLSLFRSFYQGLEWGEGGSTVLFSDSGVFFPPECQSGCKQYKRLYRCMCEKGIWSWSQWLCLQVVHLGNGSSAWCGTLHQVKRGNHNQFNHACFCCNHIRVGK